MSPIEYAHPLFPELFRDDVLRIETKRLWLRWLQLADAPALQEVASFEAASQSASWPRQLGKVPVETLIGRARAENASGTGLTLALTPKARPWEPIGLIGLARKSDTHALALGYLLGVEHQGLGLMTEAVRELVDKVFRYAAFTRIEGLGGRGNIASQRVMEKAGFRIRAASPRAAARKAAAARATLELARCEWRDQRRAAPAAPKAIGKVEIRDEMPCGQAT
jgi:RimJ/RimL family protein N-acetyltransferase